MRSVQAPTYGVAAQAVRSQAGRIAPDQQGVIVGSLVAARLPKASKPKQPAPALRRGEPVALVRAVCRVVENARRTRDPEDAITFSTIKVLIDLDVMHDLRAAGLLMRSQHLVRATFFALGLVRGTRGTAEVFRLLSETASPQQLSGTTSAAPAQRINTGPPRVKTTQRRLAAEKCVKPGNVST